MNKDERAELRKLADGATPGPWKAFPSEWPANPIGRREAIVSHRTGGGGHALGRFVTWPGDDNGNADAAFIAASRTAIPALLDYVDELERSDVAMRMEIDKYKSVLCSLEAQLQRERGK